MPIIESAIKRARQNIARRERRQPFKSRLKSVIKTYTELMKEGKKDEAKKLLPTVMKVIDTSAKKHLLHRNTASRKKSQFAKMLASK
ncbi:30S ribosomal protein S20 [Candidatus Peregrinibacteria bacterium]|nr:30S ribosomal protein S20 [Candidatus Peregrinibacteria bacterium]